MTIPTLCRIFTVILLSTTCVALRGADVGRIPGTLSNNSMGAAIYTIPIECPVGVGGLQPSIALVYNSLGGNGIAGWGWDIVGTSTILRAGQTTYYDSKESDITWTGEDPYTLDGQRLFKDPDSVNVYRLENDPGTLVRAYSLTADRGPQYFKAFTKDGLTMTYTRTIAMYQSAALLTASNYVGWCLSEVEDANGNYMQFTYTMNLSASVVSTITYGGNKRQGTTGTHVISFQYATRPDPVLMRTSGKETFQRNRLTRITVSSQNETQRAYHLNYEPGTISHLASLELSGGTTSFYAPLTFSYGEENTPLQTDVTSSYGGATSKKDFIVALDLDGDGKCEIYHDHYRENGLDGLAADFNGNGSADLISFRIGTGNRLGANINDRSAGLLFAGDLRVVEKRAGENFLRFPFITTGNFLGSHTAEALVVYQNYEKLGKDGAPPYKYRYDLIKRGVNGSPFVVSEDMFFTVPCEILSVHTFKSGGVNYYDDLFLQLEDGSTHILTNSRTRTACFSYSPSELIQTSLRLINYQSFTFQDYDADGLLDVVYRNGNRWKVAINLGNHQFEIRDLPSHITAEPYNFTEENDRLFMVDLNGDGRMDLVIADELSTTRTHWKFYLRESDDSFRLYHEEYSPERAAYACLADLRGNGTVSWLYMNSQHRMIIKDFDFPRNPNLLTRVTNPVSPDLKLTYKPQSQASLRQDSWSGTTLTGWVNEGYSPLKTSQFQVLSQSEDGLNVIRYEYGTPLMNWAHRGYLGFMYHQAYNLTTRQRKYTAYTLLRSGGAVQCAGALYGKCV